MSIHLSLTNVKKSCSLHCVILSWENQQQTTTLGLVPLGQWDTAYPYQSGKQKEEMVYGHQIYNFSIGLWMPWQKSLLLSVRENGNWKEAAAKTREVRKNGNCCITELLHRNEWLQCNKLPHTSFSQSTFMLISLGDLFFKYGVAFPRVKEKNTKSNYFPFIVDCHRVRIYQQQVITGQLTDACVSNPLDQKLSWACSFLNQQNFLDIFHYVLTNTALYGNLQLWNTRDCLN